MRLIFVLLSMSLLFLGRICCEAAPSLELHIDSIVQPGEINIRMINKSSRPVNLWDESNSWGYGCWRILIIKSGSIDAFYANPDVDFTMNVPSYQTIKPRGSLSLKLNLKDQSWVSSKGAKGNLESGDTVVTMYDVPTSYEGRKRDVWSGVAVVMTLVK